MNRTRASGMIVTAVMLAVLAPAGYAEDACATFKWDVASERTLFSGAAQTSAAARDLTSAVQLVPGRLYALSLAPQAQIQLAAPLGRKAGVEGVFGGLAHLKVATAGRYRISLDQAGWIDVVGEHGTLTASDFSGASDCSAPHKIVQFELPAGELVLQLTGIRNALIRLAVTPVPTPN